MNTSHRIPEETPEPAQIPIDLARDAITHTLRAICESPAKYWLMGAGTESYAQLTAAYAALRGMPVEEARAYWQPDRAEYARFQEAQRTDRDRLELVQELLSEAGTTERDDLRELVALGRDVRDRRRLNSIDGGAQ